MHRVSFRVRMPPRLRTNSCPCTSGRPPFTLCAPRPQGTTGDGLELDNLTDLGGLHKAGVLRQLIVDEVHNGHRPSKAGFVKMRKIAWEHVAAAESSEHLVLWASSERPSNWRHIVNETAAVSWVRNFLANG